MEVIFDARVIFQESLFADFRRIYQTIRSFASIKTVVRQCEVT